MKMDSRMERWLTTKLKNYNWQQHQYNCPSLCTFFRWLLSWQGLTGSCNTGYCITSASLAVGFSRKWRRICFKIGKRSFSASESVHFNVAAYCERRGRRVASLSFNLRLSSSMTWLLVIELNGQVMLSTRNCIFAFNKSLCKSRSAERDFSNSFFSSENWYVECAYLAVFHL